MIGGSNSFAEFLSFTQYFLHFACGGSCDWKHRLGKLTNKCGLEMIIFHVGSNILHAAQNSQSDNYIYPGQYLQRTEESDVLWDSFCAPLHPTICTQTAQPVRQKIFWFGCCTHNLPLNIR